MHTPPRTKRGPGTVANRPGRTTLAALLCAALAIAATPAAQADVWGYVDDQGNTHFSTRPLDDRYQLYFRTGNTPAPLPPDGFSGSAQAAVAGSGLAFNPAADAAAGLKARRLVALINQSKSFLMVRETLQKEAARHGINGNLIKAIAATESGFNPRAVSPAGAVGLMQVMPDTARLLGLRDDNRQTVAEKLTDSSTNIQLGARYLGQLLRQFGGRTHLAVAAYNAGPGAVSKRMAIPPYAETQDYVRTVMAIYETLQPGVSHKWVATGAAPAASTRRTSAGARKRVVLAGARTATGQSVRAPSSAPPALLTLKAQKPGDAPSALDAVAEKITVADSLAPPELGADVTIKPASTP